MAQSAKSNWLWKWTNYLQGYQRRWCVIEKGRLSYYSDKHEVGKTCRGTIKLNDAFITITQKNCFTVSNDAGRIYYFMVNTEEDMLSWIIALGNQKYFPNPISQSSEKYSVEENKGPVSIIEMRKQRNDLELAFSVIKQQSEKVFRIGEESGIKEENLETIKRLEISSNNLIKVATVFRDAVMSYQRQIDKVNFSEKLETADSDSEYSDAIDDTIKTRQVPNLLNGFITNVRKRRTRIPFKKNYSINLALWNMFKNVSPKEMYKVPLPVNLNEPLSMLQRLAEDMEYSLLLDKGAQCKESCLQLSYVVAFSVSGYSTTRNRTSKPFNPLLGETFECDRDDLGFGLVAEQVCHHPPISAMYAESKHGLWSYWIEWSLDTTFCGNYVNAYPSGTYHCVFHESGNHYTWKKVSSVVHNIIIGKVWVEQLGETEIINHATGDRCSLKYTGYSMFRSSQHKMVKGTIKDNQGVAKYAIQGFWDSHLNILEINQHGNEGDPVRIWTVNEPIKLSNRMYNFTSLSVTLNEPEVGVAPTDSRLRPDQRLMEEGDWDEANKIKMILEEMQRKRKREKEKRVLNGLELDAEHVPRWFERTRCSFTNEVSFTYNNEYWKCKENQKWTNPVDIFALK